MTAKVRVHPRLEARLGHSFSDPRLLDTALTHSSAISPAKRVTQSYQRLEFLGDRVLGLVVADLLYKRFPLAPEGDLNRSFVTLVRGETCAAIARHLELGKELNLGDSERRSGGDDNSTILADVTEAVLGALYLDGGLPVAYAFLESIMGDKLDLASQRRPDPKTTLQEWAQGRGLEPPDYKVVDRSGPEHAPEFTISVELGKFAPLSATGPSKRLAEHKAAEAFLLREKIWRDAS